MTEILIILGVMLTVIFLINYMTAQHGDFKGMMIFLLIGAIFISSYLFFTSSNKNIIEKNRVHTFADIIEPSKIHKYQTLNYVGNIIQKRDSFYDNIYEVSIRMLDKVIVFIGLLIPIAIIIWLLPIVMFIFNHNDFDNMSITEMISTLLIIVFLGLAFVFLFYILGFYINTLMMSLSTILLEVIYIIFQIVFATITLPIILILLVFQLTNTDNTFVFFEEGTIKNSIIELVNYHLTSLGITVEINGPLFFLLLKLFVLLLVIKNIKMIGNVIFFHMRTWVANLLTILFIVSFIFSIYYFNKDLLNDLYTMIIEMLQLIFVKGAK